MEDDSSSGSGSSSNTSGINTGGEKNFSPVFILFLDAVWQLWQQFPAAFEFSEGLLLFLADCYYDARFGTFLYSTEKERVDANAFARTVSVWAHVLAHPAAYTNPAYAPAAPTSDTAATPLAPVVSYATLRLWPAFFLRYSVVPPSPVP